MNTIKFIALIVATMVALSCDKTSRNTRFSKSALKEQEKLATTAKGIKVSDLFSTNKTNIQTRGVLSFKLRDTYVDDLSELSVINDTTEATLIDRKDIALGLNSDDDYTFHLKQESSDTIVRIYPGIADFKSKVIYGTNSLRLVAVTSTDKRYKSQNIRLRDFIYFGSVYANAVPEDNDNPMISGSMTPYAQGISASSGGDSFLFSNAIHVMTH